MASRSRPSIPRSRSYPASRTGAGERCTDCASRTPSARAPLSRRALLDRLLSRHLDAGGGQETVCQIGFVPQDGDYTGAWAPSFRLLADLGDPDRSRWQHMTGQSGHPASKHYDDLLEDWHAGRTNPVRQPAVTTLRLEPS